MASQRPGQMCNRVRCVWAAWWWPAARARGVHAGRPLGKQIPVTHPAGLSGTVPGKAPRPCPVEAGLVTLR